MNSNILHRIRENMVWLPAWARSTAGRTLRARKPLCMDPGRPIHVLVVICDHFEPRHGASSPGQAMNRVRAWAAGYPALQRRCLEAFGTRPVHTFFYPPHHGDEFLRPLAEMVFDRIGEVELHYHHQGDTALTLQRDLRDALRRYRRHGLLLQAGDPPGRGFGFIHGDWALDNSLGGAHCGVNGELSLLASLGCWGDFTMPSGGRCQTRKINSIYYAIDDSGRSKSHDTGTDVEVGRVDPPGFFLMQGPLAINLRAPDHPRIENASLTDENWGRADRIDAWLDCNIHVRGRPEWVFIKLHAHGAQERDHDALFGDKAFEMHRLLHERCNDGQHYVLHYVTARQAYNIAKAAEAGYGGDPMRWVDYRIPAPANERYCADTEHDLVQCGDAFLRLEAFAERREQTVVRCRVGPIRRLEGRFRHIEIDEEGQLSIGTYGPDPRVEVTLDEGCALRSALNGRRLGTSDGSEPNRWHLRLDDGEGEARMTVESVAVPGDLRRVRAA